MIEFGRAGNVAFSLVERSKDRDSQIIDTAESDNVRIEEARWQRRR